MSAIASSETVIVRIRERGLAHVADMASYWLIIAGVYLMYGFLFYYAGKEKLFDQNGTMPAPLAKAFHGSFIASFPGVNTSWFLLGLLEFVVFLAFALSLLSGEFMRGRRKPILLSSLGLSIFAFGLMTFAESQISDFTTVAELFGYLTATGVVIMLLLVMPPYRPQRWLSSLIAR